MDMNERFVVSSISRADIADMLNDVIHVHKLPIPTFEHDSVRLTRQVCGDIANEFGELTEQGSSEEDLGEAQRDYLLVVLRRFISR